MHNNLSVPAGGWRHHCPHVCVEGLLLNSCNSCIIKDSCHSLVFSSFFFLNSTEIHCKHLCGVTILLFRQQSYQASTNLTRFRQDHCFTYNNAIWNDRPCNLDESSCCRYWDWSPAPHILSCSSAGRRNRCMARYSRSFVLAIRILNQLYWFAFVVVTFCIKFLFFDTFFYTF